LAPVYLEAAKALKEAGSEIKLAKVDATEHKTQAGEYGVRGFPTLFFFVNGTKIDFKGDRSKEGIISWVNKKILPVTTEIASEDDFKALAGQDAVSVVLFSDDADEIAQFETLAIADDYNRYYIAKGKLLKSASSGKVKLVRLFDEVATFDGKFESLTTWVTKHSRPALLPFDQRTIQGIFGEAKKAFVFINTESPESLALRDTIVNLAKNNEEDLIFTEIDKSNEHFGRFAEYIKITAETPRILIVDGGKQKKYVQSGTLTPAVAQQFLKSFQSGTLK